MNTPSGRPASLPQLGQEQRRRRVLLARLEDEGVAAGDRVGAHPQRHHGREVERGDAGDDAERLADRVDVDAGRGLLGEAALEQLRHAAGELDVLQAAGDLAGGVGEHLAVLGGDDRGQLVGVRRAAARGTRTAPPSAATARRERHSRAAALALADRGVDLGGDGQVDLAGLLAGGRVEDRAGAAGRARRRRRRRSSA